MVKLAISTLMSALLSGGIAAQPPAVRPAPAPVRPVTEEYFGTKVTDPYRYMENMKDPAVLKWAKDQGRYTRAVVDSIPNYAAYAAEVAKTSGSFGFATSVQRYGGRTFFEERVPGSNDYNLVVLEKGGAKRTLVDVTALRAAHGGEPFAINFYQASPDGRLIAVGLSANGSEDTVMTVYDVASGRSLGSFDRTQDASPSFTADGKTLFFGRLPTLPPDAPRDQQYLNTTVFAWPLRGNPKPVFGHLATQAPPLQPQMFAFVQSFPGSHTVAAVAVEGVRPEIDLWTAPLGGAAAGGQRWTQLLRQADDVTAFDIVGDRIFLLSHKDAPTFKVLTMRIGEPLSAARTLVEARPGRVIEAINAALDGVYVRAREGVYSRLLRVPLDGGVQTEVQLPFKGWISDAFTDERAPGAIINEQSWVTPPSVLAIAPSGATRLPLGYVPPSYDQSAYEVLDLRAPAKDGVAVPLSYVRQRGHVGPQIVLVSAYGSYGVSSLPYFQPRLIPFIRTGQAAHATCHVRGGGELGDDWWRAGKDERKPNTWRDLIACGEYLIANGYTTREKLFIEGGSAGGVTMGMAMTERPDLWAGVIDEVPMASALRAQFQVNGPANIPEFGTIADPQGFKNLYAMDSYQHVRDGAAYPPVLITTGLNDSRVDFWQPAKLAARLLASGDPNPVLLWVDEVGGHGVASTKAQNDRLAADRDAFIFWNARLPSWRPDLWPNDRRK